MASQYTYYLYVLITNMSCKTTLILKSFFYTEHIFFTSKKKKHPMGENFVLAL